MGAAIKGALAAVSLGVMQSLDFRAAQPPAKAAPPPTGSRNRGMFGNPLPNHPSRQMASLDRLIHDRSSNIGKIDRWSRNGTLQMPTPKTNRHLMRHGWYRRQKEKEARAAATEAWQEAAQ